MGGLKKTWRFRGWHRVEQRPQGMLSTIKHDREVPCGSLASQVHVMPINGQNHQVARGLGMVLRWRDDTLV
eukprot:5720823-Amphidinium_carterae.1